MKSIIDYTNKLKDFFAQKQALSDEVSARAKLGAHNKIPFPYYEMSKSGNGVEFTVDNNGIVTADSNGVAALGSVAIEIHHAQDGTMGLKPNVPYILSGLPTGASASTWQIYITSYTAYGTPIESKQITTSGDNEIMFETDFAMIAIYCRVQSGAVVNNIKYKPMIREKYDPSDEFTLGALTNRELTENKAEKSDLASINITGTTNSTGSTIAIGTYFYLNGQLVKAKTDIAANAAFTLNTNYEVVTAGALNTKIGTFTPATGVTAEFSIKQVGNIVTINGYGKMTISDSTGADWNNLGAVSGVSLPPSVYGIPRVLCGIAVNPWEIPLQVGYATIDRTTGELLFKTTQTGLKSIIFNITYAV